MIALDHITVEGFKSIASIRMLPLGAVNVVIGANGSGKSNFIEVFSFLHAIREGRLQDYVARAGGADKLLHFGVKTTSAIHIELSFDGGVNGYSLDLASTQDGRLYPANEQASYWDKAKHPDRPFVAFVPPQGREAGISEPLDQGMISHARRQLARWRLYHFHDTSRQSPMKQTADVHDNHYLRPDGSNLAAFLYLLQERHPAQYQLINRTVRQIAPFLDRFSLSPQSLNPEKIRLEWRHLHSEQYFDASALSDGTLRFIALATLLLQPEQFKPSVILVDEPELGLHPAAIVLLASMIQSASAATQVILSTQSSLLLDQFSADEVLVADRVQGGTVLTRQDSAKLQAWLEDYSLGQLWEKNELGGRPVQGSL